MNAPGPGRRIMTLTAGARLGHYRILAKLGEGGMGEVWVAEDTRLKRKVALKVLPTSIVADPSHPASADDRLARFQREAEAVAALSHPNIVTIYSIEEDAGVRFITMELVDGQSLEQVIPRGGLPLVQVLDIGVALAGALVASHEVGIVHRDLKPANVMLAGRERRVKVLDFGLAKLRDQGAPLEGETRTAAITGEGKVLGTVAYMSPEQAQGQPVDARSDLFSLGVMLYELATGERPFKGDTSLSVLSAILRDTPASVTALRAGLPREFGRIVRRCLQKDPEERYQTAKDVRADLKALRAEVDSGEVEAAQATVAGTGKAPKRRVSRWALGVGVLLVVAVASAIAVWRYPRAPVTRSPRPFESISLKRLTTRGNIRAASISPDGQYVAFVAKETDQQTVILRQIATAVDRVVVPAGPYWYFDVTFSRNGAYLFLLRRSREDETVMRKLYQVSVLGGDPRKILDDVDSAVALSPDGAHLAFIRGNPARGENALMVARIDGSDVKTLASRPYPNTYSDERPAWSPDGKRLVVSTWESGANSGVLVAVSTEDGSETRLGPGSWGALSQAAWLPDGTGLLTAAADAGAGWFYQLWFVPYPNGTPLRISSDPNNYQGISVSLSGKTALTLQSDWLSTVWVAPSGDPERAEPLTDGKYDGFGGLAWAGGDTIVFGTRDWGIWSVRADGRNRKLLTVGENNNEGPCVPQDDPRVIFFESWRTPAGVWRMDLDGGNARLVAGADLASGPECTPDGHMLLYLLTPSEIRRARPDGTAAPPIKARIAGELAVSPDGTRIAYQYPDPVRMKLMLEVIPSGGGTPEQTFDAPTGMASGHGALRWTPDGRALSYIAARGGVSNIWLQPIAGGPARQLTHFADGMIWAHAWAPDGRLALARGRVDQDIVLITSEDRK